MSAQVREPKLIEGNVFHAQVMRRVLKQQRIQELTDVLLQIDENILMLSEVLTTITSMTCSAMRCQTLQLYSDHQVLNSQQASAFFIAVF